MQLMSAGLSDYIALLNAFLTSVFAFLTYLILRANRSVVSVMEDQMTEQNRPFLTVFVKVRVGTPVLQLLVVNSGRTAAKNISMSMSRSFYQYGEVLESKDISKYSAFSKPIDSLPPSAELLFDLGMGFNIFAPDASEDIYPKIFTVSVSYEGCGKKYLESTTIDLWPYLDTNLAHDPIVEQLEKISKSIDRISK